LSLGASRSVLRPFSLSNNFCFLYLSHYTTFEYETWQFTETSDIECGKIFWDFYYIMYILLKKLIVF
jgi:hypothetical protein